MSLAKQQSIAKIKQLKQDIAMLILLNNALVEQIWQIDEELKGQHEPQKTEALNFEKNKLNQQIDEEKYLDKIQALKQALHDLELQVYGKSEALWHSPSRRNRFP